MEHHKPASKVPAFLNVTDIAGLVKGASEGQGLGNAFLSHIKACDALFHLCRTFEDPDITHVEGDVDPVRDLDIINEELRLKDIEYFEKVYDEVERKYCRGGDKTFKNEYEILSKIKKLLMDDKKHLRFGDWNQNDIEGEVFHSLMLESTELNFSFEQASLHHIQAHDLPGQPV